MTESPPSALAPFRHRPFTVYWLTGLAANFGWLIQGVGASWAMTAMDGRPEMVALVQSSVALPIMLFSLPAGALSDAFGRRATVLWSQAWLLVVSSVLALAAWADWLSPWSLLAFTFLIGSGKALNNPGWQTMVTELVPKADLAPAIAMNSVGFNLARSVGPAIGGILVGAFGAFAAFLVNALANLTMILAASRWRLAPPDTTLPPEGIASAMAAGLRFVAMSPGHLAVLLRGFWMNAAGISVLALMPLVARDHLGGGPGTYGLLLGGFGIGAVAGAFAGTRLRARFRLETCVRAGFVICAGGTGLLAAATVLPLSLLGAGLAGAAWLVTLSSFNTKVQLSSPRWVLSRAQALYMSSNFAGNALGGLVWGMTAGALGTGTALGLSALALVFGAGIGLIRPLRDHGDDDLTTGAPGVTPEASIDMLPTSGPIVVTLTYRIRVADQPEFLGLMAQRRRARLRDGARGWTLSRDIMEPEIWYERYRTPTWIETRRHHLRRTAATARISEALRSLQQGGPWQAHYELIRPAVPPHRHPPMVWTEE